MFWDTFKHSCKIKRTLEFPPTAKPGMMRLQHTGLMKLSWSPFQKIHTEPFESISRNVALVRGITHNKPAPAHLPVGQSHSL